MEYTVPLCLPGEARINRMWGGSADVIIAKSAVLQTLLSVCDQSGGRTPEGRKRTESGHTPPAQKCRSVSCPGGLATEGLSGGAGMATHLQVLSASLRSVCLQKEFHLGTRSCLICNQVPKVVGGCPASFTLAQVLCSAPLAWGGGGGRALPGGVTPVWD